MEILLQPDSLSLVGSMNPFEIYSTKEITFVLRDVATQKIIVQHTYTPNDSNRVTIKLKDIILPLLSFKVVDSSEPYEQPDILKAYEVTVGEVGDGTSKTVTFSVLRAGVDKLSDSASNFLKTNFLTWQPNVKAVTYYSPEFLTYYAQETCVLMAELNIWNGSGYENPKVALATMEAGKVWTVPVQYAIVSKMVGKETFPSYYDVWVESTDGTRLTYIQRYYASDMRSEQEEWFLFENSLGGIDCFRAYGNSENTAEHTHNVAEIDEDSEEYRVDTTRKYKKNTGFLDKRERLWLLDFFPSLGKYHYQGNTLRKITVTESDVNYEAKELPSNYTFTYKYSDARPYLNLKRTDVKLSAMHIHVPDLGNFTIAPRLVEFPKQTLSDGALFPVQSPYSEEWGVTTFASLYAQMVAQLADGYKGGGGIGHTHTNFDLLSSLTEFMGYVLMNGEKLKAGLADMADDFVEDGKASKKILRKDVEDEAQETISFRKGLLLGLAKAWGINENGLAHLSGATFGDYEPDTIGAAVLVNDKGVSHIEADYLTVRRAADFREISIRELRYIGGELAITPAAMQVSKVERLDSNGQVISDDETEVAAFKCYFNTEDGNGQKKLYQEFVEGDQARCQQFGMAAGTYKHVKTKYYWRLVTAVGDDFIVLSNKTMDTTMENAAPSEGDNIVQLGYQGSRNLPNRQSAIILSATANDAPSQKYYQGINDFSLKECMVKDEGYDAATGTFHSKVYGDSFMGDRGGNGYLQYDSKTKTMMFKGTAHFDSDSTKDGEQLLSKSDLHGLDIKSGNLLRNTSFCGDYESIDVADDMDVSSDKDTFSEKQKYWSMSGCTIIDNDSQESKKAVSIQQGTLSQALHQPLIADGEYTLSFRGSGTTVTIEIGGNTLTQQMDTNSRRYELHFTCKDSTSQSFVMRGNNCTIGELMLSYGTIAPAWSPAYSDNDKSLAKFQSLKFLTDAMTEGSTTIDGGLVMSQQFRVGNYRDKHMVKETGGMSGYYNDDNSPFIWGGGSLEQAVYTIQRYSQNPSYQPTPEELENMAKFVVTHGGRAILNDIILHGYIYAKGGVLQSVRSPNGNFSIDEQGNAKLKGGNIAGWTFRDNFIGNNPNLSLGEVGNKNEMSLLGNLLCFNGEGRQAAFGVFNLLSLPVMLMLLDEIDSNQKRFGISVSVKNRKGDACAMEIGGGYVSGLALQTGLYDKVTNKMDRYVNVALLFDENTTYYLPDMQPYDDGHMLMVKRINGATNDRSVKVVAGKYYDKEGKENQAYILHDQGEHDTELILASACDAATYIFSNKLSFGDYKGCWVEFKNPRDW